MATPRSTIGRAAVVVGVAGLAMLAATVGRLWLAWGDVDHIAFDPDAARAALAATSTVPTTVVANGVPTTVAAPGSEFEAGAGATPDDAMEVFLIIGSDERSPDALSRRADVIMLFILPTDGSPPVLTSIPRDLYLPNPCSGRRDKVNSNLNGCGATTTGPEQMAIVVEDFTGVPIDHFVLFTFEGFRQVIDRVGGVEVCPATAVRDPMVDPVGLDLPAGCSIANGDQALAWVRSRHTLGLIDGRWVPLATNDLDRIPRQQDLVIQALRRLRSMSDVSELSALIDELADSFTIDQGLGLGDVISTAWGLRSVDPAQVARPVLPVTYGTDDAGQSILLPQATFESIVVAANPNLAQYFTHSG